MITLDYSDLVFAGGATALLAIGWTKTPPLEAPIQHPHPIIELSQLEERYIRSDFCTVTGRLRNIGSATLREGELVLNVEAALDIRASRVFRLASTRLARLHPGSVRQFTLSYACSELIGSPRYRVVSSGLPVPVRGG